MEARNYKWILPSYRNFGFDWSPLSGQQPNRESETFVTSDIDFPRTRIIYLRSYLFVHTFVLH